jgi:hypothetical protein
MKTMQQPPIASLTLHLMVKTEVMYRPANRSIDLRHLFPIQTTARLGSANDNDQPGEFIR